MGLFRRAASSRDPAAVAGEASRWIGAGLIPARGFGYIQVGPMLAVLELRKRRLTVRVRPALLAKLFGIRSLTATPADAVETFRVRDRSAYQGIELRPPQRSSFYVYIRQRENALPALAAAGFTVSQEPGRERPVWYQPGDD